LNEELGMFRLEERVVNGKGYAQEAESETARNRLLLFPVSRLRIPKIRHLRTSKSLQSQNPQTISRCFAPRFLGCVFLFSCLNEMMLGVKGHEYIKCSNCF